MTSSNRLTNDSRYQAPNSPLLSVRTATTADASQTWPDLGHALIAAVAGIAFGGWQQSWMAALFAYSALYLLASLVPRK